MVELVDNSNLLDVKSGILCHQVNCVGVMGAGIALQIKGKWPEVFKQYKDKCDLCSEEPRKLLGGCKTSLFRTTWWLQIALAKSILGEMEQ